MAIDLKSKLKQLQQRQSAAADTSQRSSSPAAAKVWSFSFDSIELKQILSGHCRQLNIAMGSLINCLIYDYLSEQTDLDLSAVDQPELRTAGQGRPLGSKNTTKKTSTAAAVEKRPVGRPKKEPEPIKIPKVDQIVYMCFADRSGLYPVGPMNAPVYVPTEEDRERMRKERMAGNNYVEPNAHYVDYDGNCFDDAFWWYNGDFYAGNHGSNRAFLVDRAIEGDRWFPTDENDPRLTPYYKEKLFGSQGYLLPGNGYDQGIKFKDWVEMTKEPATGSVNAISDDGNLDSVSEN